jgi:hypothetical protein
MNNSISRRAQLSSTLIAVLNSLVFPNGAVRNPLISANSLRP